MNTPFDHRAAALFDIDGTLVDSNRFHVFAWEEAFRQHSRPVLAESIEKQIGKGGDQLVPSLVPDVKKSEAEAISALHDEIFRARYLSRVRPFNGAAELVRCLHDAGLEIVLASSANRAEVDHYIQLLDIASVLKGSTSADEVSNSKPAGDIFAAALKSLGQIDPSDVVVVGDTPYDIEAARKCELDTVAVQSGGFSREALAGAIALYPGVADILATFAAAGEARKSGTAG